jgi:hypothetical protein
LISENGRRIIEEFVTTRANSKDNAERHKILLPWILQKIPAIEAELKESMAAAGSWHAGRGTKRKLRDNLERPSKRYRNSRDSKSHRRISDLTDATLLWPQVFGIPAARREDSDEAALNEISTDVSQPPEHHGCMVDQGRWLAPR